MFALPAALLAACTASSPAHAVSPRPVSPKTVSSGTASPGLFAIDPHGLYAADSGPEGVAAMVNGHPILRRTVLAICLRKYRAPIVDQMIQNYVLERACTAKKIAVSDAEIDFRMEALRKSVAPMTLEAVLAEHHATLAQVRTAVKHRIQQVRLVAGQVPPEKMVHCRAIFIKFSPPAAPAAVTGTTRSEADALALINGIQAQISAGTDFKEEAVRYSEAEPNNKGDIGILYSGSRTAAAPVVEAALALDVGQLSVPIRASGGYWLLQAESTSDAPLPNEAAAYTAARRTYTEEQAQFLSPKAIVDLIDASKITFASDADCDPLPGKLLPAAATVDGHPIPMPEVAAQCLAENGPRVVDILTQNFLVDAECQRRGLRVPEAEIDRQVENLRRRIAPRTLEAGLAARHMTLPELRDGFRQDAERILLVSDQVKPSHMVHCRVILIRFQPGGQSSSGTAITRTDPQALALIRKIQADLQQGQDFETLAARYSEASLDSEVSPNSELTQKTGADDLGVLFPGLSEMDPDLLQAGLLLNPGQMTATPVRTVDGYSVIQCLSSSSRHRKSEDAAYFEAASLDRKQQAQPLIFPAITALLKQSKIVYYLHA